MFPFFSPFSFVISKGFCPKNALIGAPSSIPLCGAPLLCGVLRCAPLSCGVLHYAPAFVSVVMRWQKKRALIVSALCAARIAYASM